MTNGTHKIIAEQNEGQSTAGGIGVHSRRVLEFAARLSGDTSATLYIAGPVDEEDVALLGEFLAVAQRVLQKIAVDDVSGEAAVAP